MGEDIYKYRRKMLAETYLFRFQDEFLVNLYAMPTKKIFSKTKVYYDWENVIDIPIIIFDTKKHLSYKFYITYIARKHGNVIVSVKYKNKDTIMKYDSFIAKKQYAERNNIPMYFVDAKQSDLRYILNSIKTLDIPYISINYDDIRNILMRRGVI
ncbi:hypothetical protein [Staphylococcus phage PMBT8]|nr:hypothetical protein [Staphylococcus phage PMBT8]